MSLYKSLKILCLIGLLSVGKADADSKLEIGGSYTRAHIKVGEQSSFRGNLGGVQALYEYKPCNGIYEGLKIVWKQGNTENCDAKRELSVVDSQERLGYTYATCCNEWSLTFFSGLGFRYFGHKLKTVHESIKFDYNEFYIPVGFLSEYLISSQWSVGCNVTWMPQIYSTVKITPLKGARWILKNRMVNVSVELPLTYFFKEKCYYICLKPFYEHFENGRSTAKTFSGQKLDLPKNSYQFWGIELNIGFLF